MVRIHTGKGTQNGSRFLIEFSGKRSEGTMSDVHPVRQLGFSP
jgi:hypothetical protein